ncbi:MAG: 4-hydroxybenzoate octaprenyltransferase, partial [Burkholderiales bacterium]
MQDREDDALVGIRSSALRLGNNLRLGVALFYLLAVLCWTIAFWMLRHEAIALLAVLPVAAHLALQIWRLRSDDAGGALDLFRSNRWAGLLMALGCWVVGNAGL